MRQPDIGLKVAELRQQKNITQEQLSELCEVSTRTIQRIEAGEVEPRAYTRSALSDVLGFDFNQDNTENEGLWLALIHLSSMIPLVIFPLVLWSWKKNQSYEIDRQGKQAINFQITMAIVLFAASACAFFAPMAMMLLYTRSDIQAVTSIWPLTSLAPLPMIAIGMYCFAVAVINTLRSLSDRRVIYPLSVRFVR